MSGYVPESFKDPDEKPKYLSEASERSVHGPRERTRKKRQEEGMNNDLKGSQNVSGSKKACSNAAKRLEDFRREIQNPSESLPSSENAALLRVRIGTSKGKMELDRGLDIKNNVDQTRDTHREKFRATLYSLTEEFENAGFGTRNHVPGTVRVMFKVHYITRPPSQCLAVTGNRAELGNWERFVPLQEAEDGFWTGTVTLSVPNQIEWKFVLVDDGEIRCWEECGNRQLLVPSQVEEIQLCCEWGYP